MNLNFYRCRSCGQIAAMVKGVGLPMCCCDQAMEYMLSNFEDAREEIHVPVIQYSKGDHTVRINVGKTPHPKDGDHYIQWIAMETSNGMQFKKLKPGENPEVTFHLDEGEKIVDVFCYCNKHSLWKADIKKIIFTK